MKSFSAFASFVLCVSLVFFVNPSAKAAEPVEVDGYKLTWTTVNWQGGISVRGGQLDWEASLGGKLSAPANRQIVGYLVQLEEVRDTAGRSLLPTEMARRWSNPRRPRRENQVNRVLGRRGDGTELGNFTVSLGGGSAPAGKIASVKGTLYVMEVARTIQLDLPMKEAVGTWHEAEGVKVRVEGVEERGQQSIVSLSHTLDEEAASGEDLSKPPYVYAAVPLDERGKEAAAQMANVGNRGDGQLTVTLFTQSGQAAKPAAVRLFIAAQVKERKVPFELTDLDLGLGPGPDKPEAKKPVEKDEKK